MKARDEERFFQLITALAAMFRVDAEDALIEAYWMALEDLELGAVEKAIRTAMVKSQHMPRAVELREMAGEMPALTRARHAWEDVRRAVAAHGRYASVDFEDSIVNATVRNMGGWQRLCGLSSEEFEKWARKDFEKTYSAFVDSGITEEQGQYLVGLTEQSNGALGYIQNKGVVGVKSRLGARAERVNWLQKPEPVRHELTRDQQKGEAPKQLGEFVSRLANGMSVREDDEQGRMAFDGESAQKYH